jgi:hypothetical protein
MNLASLFNLAGPDLIIILLIVLLLFGAKKLPELHGRDSRKVEDRGAEDKFAAINRVLALVVGIAAVILWGVLSSRH